MKTNRTILLYFLAMVVVAALYRVIPRPAGFAPQLAIALFAGAIVKDKKLAFLLPLLSMLISDALYELLFAYGWAPYGGFYSGQWQNYIMIGLLTVVGFFIRRINIKTVLAGSLASPVIYFLLSNFVVWAGHGGFQRPMTFGGLMQCYADGLPFFYGSVAGTVFFSALFFGSYVLVSRNAKFKMQNSKSKTVLST